ncbi:MAE_28990/MAE_18760 family HEPN-like nuclease [Streptomyces sp. NPDC012888]|uniref:MAE_28990/MAE_18760 family HEPN-like nuclease n=1 Tax=Streptomyces sp. NPDC012888 TaxID=3364855 RepID=UPI0036C15CB2
MSPATFEGHPESAKLNDLHASAGSTANLHTFYYNGVIVGLYGLLEHFVEGLLSEFVRRVSAASRTYDDLPEPIRAHHLPLTLEVLGKLGTGKYQGKLDERTLIASLHSCLSGAHTFTLNDVVFAHHTANFRSDVILFCFNRVGVDLKKLSRSASLVQAMDRHFPGSSRPFFVVDDLAERRNEVAHGAASELLSPEILESYLDVVESFAQALLEDVTSHLVNAVVPHVGRQLGKPDRVFRHSIAGFEQLPQRVAVGDIVAVIDGEGRARCARVTSIQVENAQVAHAELGASTGVSIGPPLTQRSRLFLMPDGSGYLLPRDAN